ncbi:hypothetical protein SAMN05428938_6044 [Streptomyces sp. KS_5]|nr:hypothetical protein SAMN05428938_6044 [Streptomyces sp. KS_5]
MGGRGAEAERRGDSEGAAPGWCGVPREPCAEAEAARGGTPGEPCVGAPGGVPCPGAVPGEPSAWALPGREDMPKEPCPERDGVPRSEAVPGEAWLLEAPLVGSVAGIGRRRNVISAAVSAGAPGRRGVEGRPAGRGGVPTGRGGVPAGAAGPGLPEFREAPVAGCRPEFSALGDVPVDGRRPKFSALGDAPVDGRRSVLSAFRDAPAPARARVGWGVREAGRGTGRGWGGAGAGGRDTGARVGAGVRGGGCPGAGRVRVASVALGVRAHVDTARHRSLRSRVLAAVPVLVPWVAGDRRTRGSRREGRHGGRRRGRRARGDGGATRFRAHAPPVSSSPGPSSGMGRRCPSRSAPPGTDSSDQARIPAPRDRHPGARRGRGRSHMRARHSTG